MNERIRQLADQAELTIRTSIGTYMSHTEFNKKFAELIIMDCINTACIAQFDKKSISKEMMNFYFGVEE